MQRRSRKAEMGKTKVECKKLDVLTDTQKCAFCQKRDIDEMKYGPIYNFKNIITHYYCLLLSSNMEQNGRDSEGILGFLPDDITKEVRRGMRLYCSFCKVGGATLGCSIAKCKVVFHLPCGMKHGTLHQFYGEFKSYCAKHRPVQIISEKILAESGKGAMCGICYEKVVPRPIHETLWAPCCQKSAFFHRECVQRLAISAGYFFKCPLCNNQDKFQIEMKTYGIYIPEQDASWECVPQAYQDLLVRHDTCDSAKCICPSGRKTSVQGTRWELILCKFCGSQGIHIGCGRLKWKCPEFECDICSSNSNAEVEDRNSRNYNGNRHRLSGSNRTATQIHPSVSANREREESGESSDDSGNITISNMRQQVTTPPTTPRSERHEARQRSPQTEDRSSHKKTDAEARDRTKKMRSIVIEDSDDDIELVSETKLGLKTNDGSMIPVVQIVKGSVQKRPRICGDVSVVPEIVDCTIQMDGPSKRKDDEPVQEVVYSLPTPQPPPLPQPQPQPSTSTAYTSAPSTSYPPSSDVGQFVLVDPSTLRPEDLPPGTVLLRSVQPMPSLMPHVPPPQMPQPMPPQHPTTSTSMPMPYFSCDANSNWGMPVMQMPNIQISVNTGPGAASITAPTPARSLQRKHQERSNVIVLDDEDDDQDILDVITID